MQLATSASFARVIGGGAGGSDDILPDMVMARQAAGLLLNGCRLWRAGY
jgi:hypothetical protein